MLQLSMKAITTKNRFSDCNGVTRGKSNLVTRFPNPVGREEAWIASFEP